MSSRGGIALHIVITPTKFIRSVFAVRHKSVLGTAASDSMAGIIETVLQGRRVPKIGRPLPLSHAIPAISALEKTGLPNGKRVIVP